MVLVSPEIYPEQNPTRLDDRPTADFFVFLTLVKSVICLWDIFPLFFSFNKPGLQFQIRYLLINGKSEKPRQRGDRLDALCPFSFLVSSNAGDPGLGHQIAILSMTMGSNHLITRVQIPVAALFETYSFSLVLSAGDYS